MNPKVIFIDLLNSIVNERKYENIFSRNRRYLRLKKMRPIRIHLENYNMNANLLTDIVEDLLNTTSEFKLDNMKDIIAFETEFNGSLHPPVCPKKRYVNRSKNIVTKHYLKWSEDIKKYWIKQEEYVKQEINKQVNEVGAKLISKFWAELDLVIRAEFFDETKNKILQAIEDDLLNDFQRCWLAHNNITLEDVIYGRYHSNNKKFINHLYCEWNLILTANGLEKLFSDIPLMDRIEILD